MSVAPTIVGDKNREAIEALRGYVYQLYQSAAAWVELSDEEYLFLEIAEDYAVAAVDAISAVQVKDTSASITLNSPGVISAIDSLVHLTLSNPGYDVTVRFLTTSSVGTERALADRVDGEAALLAWRRLAKAGDATALRSAIDVSKISAQAKSYIGQLSDKQFRDQILKRLHFDCGAPPLETVQKFFRLKLNRLVRGEGGTVEQLDACEDAIIRHLLLACAGKEGRMVTQVDLLGIVQKFTRVRISQAAFDTNFAGSLAGAAGANDSSIEATRSAAILPVPALPAVRLARSALVDAGLASLDLNGLLWLQGSTGLGKTTLARMIAWQSGDRWGSANFRSLSAHHLRSAMDQVAESLTSSGFQGLIIDDLEISASDQVDIDAFQYLLYCAERADVPLVVTSSTNVPSKLLFSIGARDSITVRATDFEENEVADLVTLFGGNAKYWGRYVYLASGGGHPQLAQALIQNLRRRSWPIEELRELSAILGENSAIADIRTETRSRLLRDLPNPTLLLLQRLSLNAGRFSRRLVLDIAKCEPPIANAGMLLDDLVGPWLDQPDDQHFQTSPLLTGLAAQTLSDTDQHAIHSAIADSLTRGKQLNVTEMNTALVSTFISHNQGALFKICYAILTAPNDALEVVAEHVDALRYLNTNDLKWPTEPFSKLVLRAAQLLSVTFSADRAEKFEDALAGFETAAKEVEAEAAPVAPTMRMVILTKVLTSGKRVPHFTDLVVQLADISQGAIESLPHEVALSPLISSQGVATYGFAFMMQIGLVPTIDELIAVFEFVARASVELRGQLLSPLKHAEFEADMYVRSPWLAEDRAGTINGAHHADTFAKLESLAATWEVPDIAIACRKFRAILLDEYANKPEEATAVLESGLQTYGPTNSELIRAKAKVLYRSGDHSGSLSLAQDLIENSRLASPVERAFLAREAAISAERQGDLETARRYYLYAREGALESSVDDMNVMGTGLLADAALVSWQAGDRLTCLQDYAVVFRELGDIEPASSLRAANVRAIAHHTLLWLDQEASAEQRRLENGERPQIFPGCVSNPEPHPSIKERAVTPIELGWYMLALIDAEAGIDAGVLRNLDQHLPDGPILEGEALLNRGRLTKSLVTLDWDRLVEVARRTCDEFAFYEANGGITKVFVLPNITPGLFPPAPLEALSQFEGLIQVQAALFAILSIVRDDLTNLDRVLNAGRDLDIDPGIEALIGRASATSRLRNFFILLSQERARMVAGQDSDPLAVAYLCHSAITFAAEVRQLRTIGEVMLPWYSAMWANFISEQRFRLVSPALTVPSIEKCLAVSSGDPAIDLLDLAVATIPAVKIGQQAQARANLLALRPGLLEKSVSASVKSG